MKSPGLEAFQLSFQISPIVLTNGVAQFVPGGMLPIIAISQALNFFDGLLGGSDMLSLDRAFAHFKPLTGATLIENQYGRYTFANQSVAANAVIGEPLKVSMLMILQVTSLPQRLAVMTAMKAALELHTNLGGTYSVVTPSYLYTNCLLGKLACVGDTNTMQQTHWQWDFEQPLLTEQQALFSYNGMMSNIVNSLPSTGATSGTEVISGNPLSLASSSTSPASSDLEASNVASGISPV